MASPWPWPSRRSVPAPGGAGPGAEGDGVAQHYNHRMRTACRVVM